jgi:hypothetical protein
VVVVVKKKRRNPGEEEKKERGGREKKRANFSRWSFAKRKVSDSREITESYNHHEERAT